MFDHYFPHCLLSDGRGCPLRMGPELMLLDLGLSSRFARPWIGDFDPSDANGGFGNWFQRHAARRASSGAARRPNLSRAQPSALLLWHFAERRSRQSFFRLFGFPQRAKTLHVLANRGGTLLDVYHRSRAFFLGQPSPVGARDTYGRRFSRFPAYHLSGSRLAGEQTRSILGSSGHTAIPVHP